MLLEFCQKSYFSFKFPCYCYLEDCQFRNIPSSKYNLNFQVTEVKVYFHLKKVERGDRERKVGRKQRRMAAHYNVFIYFLYTVYMKVK